MTDAERRLHVAAIATREGCETTKAGVLDALVVGGSFDVQACPGSGKTTTVATKIVVLLDSWRRNGGICVLTHTNVAREEIQKKLRRSNTGRAALDSPHFVGTIQSFVDTFLALPYMRAKRIAVEQIDNDAFASAADDEYRRGYHNLRAWLKSKTRPGEAENRRYRALEYAADGEGLTFDGEATGLKDPKKPTYRELGQLKEALTRRGVFRHADMYHFANRYLDEYPWAVDPLRGRFPVVMVDEMQDTSATQEGLMSRLFPPDSIDVQRFGDENQKIYDSDATDDSPTSFPREPVYHLGESRRFGDFIAKRIATIAPRQQTILGDGSVRGGRHTILLFDERTAYDVIPRFAAIAAAELGELGRAPVVKAIGNRKRESEGGGTFPNYIGNYVEGFVPDAVAAVAGREGLRLRVERAKVEAVREPSAGPKEVMIAVRMLIARWGGSERPQHTVGRIMQNNAMRRRLGAVVLALLGGDLPDEAAWNAVTRPLLQLLTETIGESAPPDATTFAGWFPIDIASSAVPKTGAKLALPVHVDVQTIHSVKGENHDATLVLETQRNKHDVPMILRYLSDPTVRKAALSPTAMMHHRRMFVAMSRPRTLLCMAAAAAHVDGAVRAGLVSQGWIVEDLTAAKDSGHDGPRLGLAIRP